jgi:hypothetical protein
LQFSGLKYLFLLLVFGFGCSKKQAEEHNFYYWKTTYQTSSTEHDALAANHSKKIYIRLCDISLSYDRKAHPRNVLRWIDSADKNMEYIPVIFIENEVFGGESITERPTNYKSQHAYVSLAKNITKLLNTSSNFANWPMQEVQIDCDWTASTRDAYFEFLTQLKENNPKLQLSATIRLHQIKYAAKTGIPPIDKAVLMCYNMGEIKNVGEQNSIYSLEVIKDYVGKKTSYEDIPMAIALPVYAWSLNYRNDNFIGIINNLPLDTLKAYSTAITSNTYKCTGTQLQAYKILPGDVIRYEQVSSTQLKEGKDYLTQHLKNWNQEIIYFDLDSNTLINYDKKIL